MNQFTASGGRQSPLGDELTAAQSRALTRFGNPAKIARQLWLDAMQEKLMAQRLITGASFVVAITAIVLVVLMWKDMMTHRDLLMEQMAIQRQENAQLLTQLNASYSKLTEFSQLFDQFKLKDQPTKAIPVSASSDIEWLSYKIDVRQGDVDGPPATGLRVYFTPSRSSSQGSDIPPVDLVTDENGHADFGLVRYGVYHLDMWTPAGENYSSAPFT
ncbi:MAG: hypothetical protein R3B91_06695 [Planctomycetaceae bacterium]